MSDWIDTRLRQTVRQLTPVSAARRATILAGPSDRATHRRHFDELAALREIEVGGQAPRRDRIDGPARVVFWNTERLRHIDAISNSLTSITPDVALLCEIDRGMARTENTDRLRDLAERLGYAYAYAVEFIELGLGDLNEQRIHAGSTNDRGFHGAAIFSDASLVNPFLIRIDARGDWFDGSRHEPRVGGTIAVGAYVTVASVSVMMVNVHLESHGDPAERANDMERLLTIIDGCSDHTPVLLGGDFNTSTGSYADKWSNRAAWLDRLQREPDRLVRPESYEPLFACAARFGYEWRNCNVANVSTQRFPVDDDRPRMKLDWFFTRNLLASDPQIVQALRPNGLPSSDHDGLVVTVSA